MMSDPDTMKEFQEVTPLNPTPFRCPANMQGIRSTAPLEDLYVGKPRPESSRGCLDVPHSDLSGGEEEALGHLHPDSGVGCRV